MMARNFKELEAKMSPQRLARIDLMARETMVEMLLAEIRRQAGLTQTDLANALGIKQPSLSKLEAQEDMQISTLRRIIKALGGEMGIIANLPGGTVKLSQFKDDPQPV